MRVPALLALAMLVAAGCSCEDPTDEERLREQLDVTKVHLYVASKMALGDAEADGRVEVARDQLVRAYQAAVALREGENHVTLSDVIEGTEELELEGAAIDLVALARALFELRAMGRDEVRRWGDEEAPLILPVLFGLSQTEDAATLEQVLDRDSEHALILLTLFIAKFHPRVPIPVPPELMLYEGYVTDIDAMAIAGLAPFVRGIRAYIYATSTYCDLARVDGQALDQLADEESRGRLGEAIQTVGVESTEEIEVGASAALSALAHGSTALCYMDRGERERMNEELTAFCDRAEEIGVPPEELAMLRAYLAVEEQDFAEAREQLALARTREGISDAEVEDIDRLIGYLEDEEPGLFSDYFNSAYFATWTLHYALARLEESGFLEGLEETAPYRALLSFLVAVTSSVQSAQRSIPSFDEAAEQGSGWFTSLFE